MRTLVHPRASGVNTLVTVAGKDFERFVRARWSREKGGIRGLSRETGIAPETIYRWFRDEQPELSSLAPLARVLGVNRYELVAAFDGHGPMLDLGDQSMQGTLFALIDEWGRQRGLLGPGPEPPTGPSGVS